MTAGSCPRPATTSARQAPHGGRHPGVPQSRTPTRRRHRNPHHRRTAEPGCLEFRPFQDVANSAVFYRHEIYGDTPTRSAHTWPPTTSRISYRAGLGQHHRRQSAGPAHRAARALKRPVNPTTVPYSGRPQLITADSLIQSTLICVPLPTRPMKRAAANSRQGGTRRPSGPITLSDYGRSAAVARSPPNVRQSRSLSLSNEPRRNEHSVVPCPLSRLPDSKGLNRP